MPVTSTSTANVAEWIIDEILSVNALAPLRGKRIILPMINYSDIDGTGSETRSIRSYNELGEAVDDAEGVTFTNASALSFNANIDLVPEDKIASIQITNKMLELVGRMKREQVIQAVTSENPAVLPLVNLAVQEILAMHYKRAERETLELFSGASESVNNAGNPFTFAMLIEGLMKLTDNNTAHEDYVAVIETIATFDLRSLAAGGSGAALSSLFNTTEDLNFFKHNPDVSRTGFRGSFAGIPLFEADKALMATANGAADRVGAMFALGSGPADSGKRGFAEFCERGRPIVQFVHDPRSNILEAIGRWPWVVGEHTDAHILKMIYDID
jgi:hypothetical protein